MQQRLLDAAEPHDRIRRAGLGSQCAQRIAGSTIRARQHERQRGQRAEAPARLEHGVDRDGQVPPLVEVADVQEKRRGDLGRQRSWHPRTQTRESLDTPSGTTVTRPASSP